ncbi:head maturation protease, ClpP-related, partial [Vibrio vulnificus]|uniref:head maturation protease, ClpP-related n=1 Tax=Vibrio vulnificus TaxID=672 RepID=UPI0039B49A72
AAGFRDSLKQLGDVETNNLHINSPGGSVFEGIAIYNMLKNNPAQINVYVDALAASIASVIAMSGDNIFMPSNSMLMIHNPWT